MYKNQTRIGMCAIVTIVLAGLLAAGAFAGIPEPGILLYGQVRDGTGTLISSGTMNLAFTPAAGGDTVNLSTELTEIEGEGAQFSYSVLLPMETPVPGYSASAGTIPLSVTPAMYTWTAEVVGTGITANDSMNISVADRGTAREIYVGINPPEDKDGDGMLDAWERQIIDADPNDDYASIDDVLPGDDFDGDGYTNRAEFLAGTDPVNVNDYPEVETFIEDFETGDLNRFPWTATGDSEWSVNGNKVHAGLFAAESPELADHEGASLEIMIYCDAGTISFWYAIDSEACCDKLYFYIDDTLEDEWGGNIPHTLATYPVSAGRHTFKWEYAKDKSMSEGADVAWLDDISFPGSPDNDFDGMPDGWETLHGLNLLANDSDEDADNDGFTNIREYVAGTDPGDDSDIPYFEAAIEDFETGDLSRFPWVVSGAADWSVTGTNTHGGSNAAQSPAITHNESTALETTIYSEGGDISFWYALDSEQDYDFLRFYIDDVQMGAWSGTIAYSEETYPVTPGMHTFTWLYMKDKSDSSGLDCAWLDDISFPGNVDSDSDGMPDGWEIDNDLNPLFNDAFRDADGDGASNLTEYLANTDPHVKDNVFCKGDFDNDGDVDGSDLAAVAADFGRTDCSDDCKGNFDEDSDVDESDLSVFGADFGQTDCRQ